MKPIRERIMASAGTGKTFTLAGRFLRLLFQGKKPSEILATTFTRKAAGEILERVLGWLAEAELVDSPDPDLRKKGEKAMKDLQKATCLESEITPQQCRKLLADLVQDLDTFNVRTLDSFFVESAKVFALELGLPLDWNIVDDTEDRMLRSEALSQLFGPEKDTFQLLQELSADGTGRAVHRESLNVIRETLDVFRDSTPTAWQKIQPEGKPLQEEEWLQIQDSIQALRSPPTNAGTPTAGYEKFKEALLGFIQKSKWIHLLKNTGVQKILSGEETYYKKEIPEEWRSLVQRIAAGARAVVVGSLSRRNLALFDFLARFDASYAQIKIKSKSFRFEDFPRALAKQGGLGSFFRLNRQIDHLLLDEFQDTSVTQWRVLAPLIDRVLHQKERSFFCVGDAKQSIYGWREGEPRLLKGILEWYPNKEIQQDELSESYRSSPAIMTAVNKVYENLSSNPALERELEDNEDLIDESGKWCDTFDTHTAIFEDLPGSARLYQTGEPGNAEHNKTKCIQLAVERIQALHEECSEATIGVLVRRKKWIPELLYQLQKKKVPASGEGGNPLTDSKEVLALLALFHFVDHPGDTASLFHVGTSFLGKAFDVDENAVPKETRQKLAAKIRKELLQEGYGPWVTRLVEKNAIEVDAWGIRRLQQCVDLGHVFDKHAGLRPSDFEELVRNTPVEDPSAAKVKVMTIHASKGLEFDAVVLPELVTKWKGGKPGHLLTQRPDPKKSFSLVTHPLPKELNGLHPEMQESYEAWRRKEFSEMMCLLYVAMTRAKRHLEMIIPALKPSSKGEVKLGNTFADILRGAMSPDVECDDKLLWHCKNNNVDLPWYAKLKKPQESHLVEEPPPFALAKSTGPRILPRVAPSSIHAQKITPQQLFTQESADGRLHGTLVHALFEQVAWLEDFKASREELFASLGGLQGTEKQKEQAVHAFQGALQDPSLKEVLSRSSWDSKADLEVHQEYDFKTIVKDEGKEAALMRGSVDRLVIQKENGVIQKVFIYDYKTDAIRTLEDEERQRKHHQAQMNAYQEALGLLFSLNATQVDTEILFVG